MPGKDRERRLARERYERNLANRAAARERARRRNAVVGAVIGVVVVVGGSSALAVTMGFPGGGDAPAQADGSSPQAQGQQGQQDQQGQQGQQGQETAAGKGDSGCSYERVPKNRRTEYGEFVGLPPTPPKPGADFVATLDTNRGEIVIKMLNDKAPCTVNSFQFLASEDFYDKTECHRMLTDGSNILQCGDPSGTGRGGPGYSFGDENLDGAKYTKGTVAMANSGPNTNGSQFFMVFGKASFPPNYTPFGTITAGIDVLQKIAETGLAEDGVAPKKKVVIQDVKISKVS